MTEKQFALFTPQMHPSSFAESPPFTITAFACFCPAPITVWLEPVLPYIYEIIPVDVSLVKIRSYASTGRNTAVCQNRCYRKSGLTSENVVSDLSLVWAEESFATIICVNVSLLPASTYEIHQKSEFIRSQLEHRVICSSPDGKNSEQSPLFHSQAQKVILDPA